MLYKTYLQFGTPNTFGIEVNDMGKILRQKLKEDTIVAEIALTKEEARDLGGEMENITLFTEEKATVPTKISLRGRNEATKYFLIPKTLRRSINTMGSVSCQRIRRTGRDIFVYVVHHDSTRQSYLPE
jgi:hypothetical protein